MTGRIVRLVGGTGVVLVSLGIIWLRFGVLGLPLDQQNKLAIAQTGEDHDVVTGMAITRTVWLPIILSRGRAQSGVNMPMMPSTLVTLIK